MIRLQARRSSKWAYIYSIRNRPAAPQLCWSETDSKLSLKLHNGWAVTNSCRHVRSWHSKFCAPIPCVSCCKEVASVPWRLCRSVRGVPERRWSCAIAGSIYRADLNVIGNALVSPVITIGLVVEPAKQPWRGRHYSLNIIVRYCRASVGRWRRKSNDSWVFPSYGCDEGRLQLWKG